MIKCGVFAKKCCSLSLSLSLSLPLSLSLSLSLSLLGCDFNVCPEHSHCNPVNTIAECLCDTFYETNDEGDCVGE